MNESSASLGVKDIRDDFVPKAGFLSREFHELEKERLWPKVWQIACREEELKNVGDFVVYDICDDSIVVVRSAPDELKAFYNVCQHRGRILMDEKHGRTKFMFCKYHGWRWGLDGTLQKIQDEDDWGGCSTFQKKDLRLKEVNVDTWGGFVFINMDPDCEPLLQFLDPIPSYLDFLKFGEWRYRWYKTVILPCNWKTVLEGFNEAYHIAATHPQLLNYSADYTIARTFGPHGMYFYPPETSTPPGAPAARTGRPVPDDLRITFAEFYDEMDKTLNAMFTPRAIKASQRVLEEVPAGADPVTVIMEHARMHQEEAANEGVDLASMTNQEVGNMGQNWHMFPNHVFLPLLDGSIAYRSRPHGDDPDKCIFDIWSLVRYAPGEEPPLEREFYEDWSVDTEKRFGKILRQDFGNFWATQKGMKCRGFEGSRTNPIQEREIPNMHRALYGYLFGKDS
jgi:phenylpropionate dioxygenase-like ring-hydroxylating dioxygenase large terminal subunit